MYACLQKRLIYSNRTISWIDLLTALLEYIDLALLNIAVSLISVSLIMVQASYTTYRLNVYSYDIIVTAIISLFLVSHHRLHQFLGCLTKFQLFDY